MKLLIALSVLPLVLVLLACGSATPSTNAPLPALDGRTGNCDDPYILVGETSTVFGGAMQDVISVEFLEPGCTVDILRLKIILNSTYQASGWAGRRFARESSDHRVIPHREFINAQGERFNGDTHAVVSCVVEYTSPFRETTTDPTTIRRYCPGYSAP